MKFPQKHSQVCMRFKHLKPGNVVRIHLHGTSVQVTFRQYDPTTGIVIAAISDGSLVKFKCCDVNKVEKNPSQNWLLEGRS
ncbi:hypothetical protein DMO16_06990 [Fictibacillus sp. S7]|uniref:Uncharacterized protein n=1 Tax=Fictibacillus enclensis TaxID=1017270 RepID=A0A0V8JDH3_9BACL|nr:hypothetical protein AS030_05095 [Fictibacillus enclensis]RXY99441.1 hypothetical protein DMO16_06990 [Fictibacillus sp. S7]SCB87629.1 hypothetical protein GA0061096_1073 [Fictibacillus enclensis]